MKKATLVFYAKRLLEEDKASRERCGESEDFSVSLLVKKWKISTSLASNILKELRENEFIYRVKMIGLREPLYFIDRCAENILAEMEKEALEEKNKSTMC